MALPFDKGDYNRFEYCPDFRVLFGDLFRVFRYVPVMGLLGLCSLKLRIQSHAVSPKSDVSCFLCVLTVKSTQVD